MYKLKPLEIEKIYTRLTIEELAPKYCNCERSRCNGKETLLETGNLFLQFQPIPETNKEGCIQCGGTNVPWTLVFYCTHCNKELMQFPHCSVHKNALKHKAFIHPWDIYFWRSEITSLLYKQGLPNGFTTGRTNAIQEFYRLYVKAKELKDKIGTCSYGHFDQEYIDERKFTNEEILTLLDELKEGRINPIIEQTLEVCNLSDKDYKEREKKAQAEWKDKIKKEMELKKK